MNLQELIQLLLAKVSYLIKKHDKDENAHGLNTLMSQLNGGLESYTCTSRDVMQYADSNGMFSTFTPPNGDKEDFINDIKNYYINNYGYTETDPNIFLYAIMNCIGEMEGSTSSPCIVTYYDYWTDKNDVYYYDENQSVYFLLNDTFETVFNTKLDKIQGNTNANKNVVTDNTGNIIFEEKNNSDNISVDEVIDSTSTNPVQNKIISSALSSKMNVSDYTTVDVVVTYENNTTETIKLVKKV